MPMQLVSGLQVFSQWLQPNAALHLSVQPALVLHIQVQSCGCVWLQPQRQHVQAAYQLHRHERRHDQADSA